MLQTIKKYTLCLAELLLHICLVIYYFFYFLVKGRPELKDPSAKLCIDNKPHCCLHPTAGTTSYSSQATANGTAGAGVKLSSTTDRMARETNKTTTTAFNRNQTYWQSAKLYLRSGYQRIIYGGQRVKYGCQKVKTKLGSALSWVASFFKRTASKTNKDGTSAVPWRRVSYSDSASPLASNSTNQSSSTIPCPPPPPPSSADAQTWSSKFAQMGMSWVSKDKKPKPVESPKGKVVGGFTVTTTTTSPVGTTRTESTTDTSYAPAADNIAAGRKLSQTDQFESNSLHQTRSKRTDAAQFTFLTKQPKEPSFTESTFLKSTSTPSTPASAPFARQPSIPEPEIQFPVYGNHQPHYAQQQNSDSISSTARWKSPEPYKRAETVTAATGSRRSSGSYAEQSAASDSQGLLMGRSVYTPVFEAEQMRPVINRRSSATPGPESRASQASHYSTRASRPYTRASTVEPRSFEKATIAAEHQKYLSNAQFEMSRANALDNAGSPVQAVTRQWPPPSNATGPEIVKDLWMANSVSMMEPMELEPMMDPKAMAQSWHAEFGTGNAPIVSNHFESSSKSSYRESLYDKWLTSETDDDGAFISRAVRNPQGDERDYHKLSKEYEVVMTNPEKSVQLSSMLRAETGKGVDMFSKRREETDKYAVENRRAVHRDIDPRDLAESVTDAAMRKSVEPTDWGRLSNVAFDRTSTVTPTPFAGGPYDCRSPTPFRPLSVGMHENSVVSPSFERHLDQNRLFSPAPADRPFSPSSDNYNAMPRDWRSYQQQYH